MFSIIIPCYNEEANLKILFIKVLDLLKNYPKAEVVLVNNGSNDDSLSMLNKFRLENHFQNITICNVKENQGYGHGILAGLAIAKNDILAWTHADLQTDILDCAKAFELFNKNVKIEHLMVKGFRKERKLSEVIFSYGMALFASAKLKKWLVEVNAQPKMFHKSFYEKIRLNAPKDFSLDLYFMHHAHESGKIIAFPVKFLPRIAGVAKGGSGSDIKTKWKIIQRTFTYITKLKKEI